MLAAILAPLVLAGAPAQARALPVELTWSAPSECATAAALADDIARLAGAEPRSGPDAQRVEITVTTTSDGYLLQLRRSLPDGTTVDARELAGPDCRVLGRAAALIVVVGIDPLATAVQLEVLERPAPSPAPPRIASPPPVRAPAAAPQNEPPPATRRWRHRFLAGALGGLALGTTPGVTGSLGGWIGYAYGPLRFELAGDHAFARRRVFDDGVGLVASSSGGGVGFVLAPRLGPVLGLFGTGVQAGVQRGRGTGMRVDDIPRSDWWIAIPIVIGLEWPPDSRIALRVQGELAIAARRPALEVRAGAQPVGGFRRAEAGARLLLGPTLRLP